MNHTPLFRASVSALTGVVLAAGVLAAAAPASAAVPAPQAGDAQTATADPLPTAQLDGVAWTQVVSGDTVYVGGEFQHARPAGAAAGTSEVDRHNLMAYTLSTGVMTSFAPWTDAQVFALALSPDGSRLYVGGQFTTITQNLQGSSPTTAKRYRIAAFDTRTGALVTSFAPVVNYVVKAIVATSSTVYLGGSFATVNGAARSRLAAVRASDGATTAWAPSANAQVNALALAPSGNGVVAGGAFSSVNNDSSAYGLANISTSTGGLLPWPAGQKVRNAGSAAAILSLSVAGTDVYGSGYTYGTGGNLEGVFSANIETGALTWVEDCHGDSYSVWAGATAVYVASHSHTCQNVGGWGETDPRTFQRGLSFTRSVQGTLGRESNGNYANWEGTAAPGLIDWFPDLTPGSYTGVTQAAWSVAGNKSYVAYGGEFPKVNGVAQQGLVRFAVPGKAPRKVGPQIVAGQFTPKASVSFFGDVTLTWTANWDRDDLALTYQVYRDGTSNGPLFTTTANSTFWNRPTLTFADRDVTPGKHGYRIFATDADGNQVRGNTVEVTVR